MQVTHDNDCPHRGGRDCECGFRPDALEALVKQRDELSHNVKCLKSAHFNVCEKLKKAEAKLAQAEREREQVIEDAYDAGHNDGFHAGIEAAAKVSEDRNGEIWDRDTGDMIGLDGCAEEIRALSPASPTDTVRQAAEVLLENMSVELLRDMGLTGNDLEVDFLRALAARGGE